MKTQMKISLPKGSLFITMLSLLSIISLNSSAQFSCGAGFQFSASGSTVQFWDSSYSANGYSTQWSFGNGTGSNLPNPVVQYNGSGPWVVCLTITDTLNGCTSTTCDSIYLNSASSCYASFTSTTVDSTVTFTDASSATVTSWFWDFGDGATSTIQNPVHIYASSGYFLVCLTTADGGGCTNTYCHYVLIPSFTCDATFSTTSNGTNTVWFINNSAIYTSYLWDFGDGTVSTQMNPSHTYNSAGVYTVCLTVSDSTTGCSNTYCDSIVAGNISSVCHADFIFTGNGYTINCNNTSTGNYNYAYWSWGDGTSSNAMGGSASHTYISAGTYPVCITVGDSSTGCQDTYCQNILVGPAAMNCSIDGFVTGNGSLIDYAEVYLIQYDSASQMLSLVMMQELTPADSGYFSFNNVSSGTYLVKAAADTGAANYSSLMPSYYQQTLFWNSATDVTVCPLNFWVGINLLSGTNPGGPGFIGGNVTQGANKMEAAGDPMSNVEILLLDMNDNPLQYTYSDAAGHFGFSNLAYGTYKVYAEMINKETFPAIITISSTTPSVTDVPVVVNTTQIVSAAFVPTLNNIESVSLYPNPAKDFVTMKTILKQAGNYSLEIADVTGKVLSSETVSLVQGQNTTKISTLNIADGIYLIHLSDGINVFNLKLTVVK